MLDREELYQLYVVEQKTGKEIAAIAGVRSKQCIYIWLKKYKIPRRSMRAAQRPVEPDKKTLETLYIEQELSIDDIARHLGSSESSISRLLDAYGIQKRARWCKIIGWFEGKSLSQEHRALLSEIAKQRTGTKSPRYGVTLSETTRRKIANSLKGRFRGSDNSQWKGGQCYLRHTWMSRYEYKEWRAAVFARDAYTCQMCSKISKGDIQAHHIRPWRDFPKLRFEVDNGITLCEGCHLSTRGKEMDFVVQFDTIIQANHQTHIPAARLPE